MEEEAGKNKRRMLGNIKFIGELFKLKVMINKSKILVILCYRCIFQQCFVCSFNLWTDLLEEIRHLQ